MISIRHSSCLVLALSIFLAASPRLNAERTNTVNDYLERWAQIKSLEKPWEVQWETNLVIEGLNSLPDGKEVGDALAKIYPNATSPEVKAHILRTLGLRGGTDNIEFVVKELAGLVTDKDQIGAHAMRNLIDLCQDKVKLEAIAALTKRYFSHRSLQAHVPILYAKLDKTEDRLKELSKLVKSGDPVTAGNAAFALCQWREEEEYKDLIKMSRNKHRYVRSMLARGLLQWINRPEAGEALLALLADDEWQVRLNACQALATAGDGAQVAHVCDAMAKEQIVRIKYDVADIFKTRSGKDLGFSWDAWKKWFASNEENQPGPQGGDGSVEYFGYKLTSNRVVFIIDQSGSMLASYQGETRMEKAIKELTKAIEALDKQVMFNIIAFSDRALAWAKGGLVAASAASKKEAQGFTTALKADGGTASYDALHDALTEIPADTIYFLSDGMPSLGKYTYMYRIRMELQSLNRELEVRINCIGLLTGMHPEEKSKYIQGAAEFLKTFAEENQGIARIIEEN